LNRIAVAAGRMDSLIQDVLNYSRVVRSEFPLDIVDVGQLVRGIIDTYPKMRPEEAEITVHGDLPSVYGNEAMLMQIFSNLLGNAVKFVGPGVKPRVRLWAETRKERVRFYVQDNGIGIPADQQEKIFGIFQRVSKDYDGTGIGLAIVKKAAARLGGSVGLESEPGRGSTFWVEVRKA
jgi:signal transduction histidine kinase